MSTVPPDFDKPAPAAIVAEQEALPPGTRFGELEIVRVLGVGGFGIVYLARDHSLERDVALKEYMPSALAARGQGPQITVRSGALAETYAVGLRSFINEARLLAKFDHPSLVKVYRFWEDNATAYMVMPYVQGRTLRDTRRSMTQGPDEAWVRSVILPIMSALEVLHREGVYHRDIAPDNILLPLEGPPVLLDFGAARRVIGDRTQSLTAILKPSYAPIEQYAEMTTLRQGPWTDIYALGAVMHFLLQGTPPGPATARAIQDEMVPLWMRNYPGVTPHFLAAIDWALAVRPQERPQSIDALRAVLDGRSEPPMLARTVPGSTSLMPVSGAAVKTGYEPTELAATRPEPIFQPTVRAEPPGPAAPTMVAAATSVAAPAPVAPAAAASRKGLIGAALAVAAVLAGAAAWHAAGPRDSASPVAAAATPGAAPAVAATQPVPPATPAVAVIEPAASAAVEPAVQVVAPAAAVAPAPELPKVVTQVPEPPKVVAPVAATVRDARARPPIDNVAAVQARPSGRTATRPNRPAAGADAPATEPTVDPIPDDPSAEDGDEPRPRTLREAILASRQHPLGAPPQGPANAREACGSRVLVALWNCLQRECRRPRYAQQADCIKVNEQRRRRELP